MEEPILARRFTFPVFGDRKVLVIGAGGGCDVISAHLVAVALKSVPGNESTRVVVGNTKKEVKEDFVQISRHIYRVPERVVTIEPKMKVWRTTLIDQSIPRWADGSPYLVIAPKKPAECDLVTAEIRALGFDHIVAVDTGGDTLSMTAASNTGKVPGRDQRMLAILKNTGIPTSLVVIAPGSDGETSYKDMRANVISRLNLGNYQGWFPLEPQRAEMERLARNISRKRTPNIILRAFNRTLKANAEGLLQIPRHEKPFYPQAWLCCGMVFAG